MTIAPTLRQALDAQHTDFEIIEHQPTKSAMQTAQASNVPAEQLAKAVLLDADGEYLVAVLPAAHRIRIQDLRSELGQRPRLASEDEIDQVFDDCAMGSVPPLGHAYGVDMIVDDSIERQPDVYFEAGDHQTLVHMSHDDFARLIGPARHGSFSEPWSSTE